MKKRYFVLVMVAGIALSTVLKAEDETYRAVDGKLEIAITKDISVMQTDLVSKIQERQALLNKIKVKTQKVIARVNLQHKSELDKLNDEITLITERISEAQKLNLSFLSTKDKNLAVAGL